MAITAPPGKVSPFIKFVRWCLLGTGIMYGISNHKRLAANAIPLKAARDEERAARNKILAIEKRKLSDFEMYEIGRMLAGREPGELFGPPAEGLIGKQESVGGDSMTDVPDHIDDDKIEINTEGLLEESTDTDTPSGLDPSQSLIQPPPAK